jgi:lysozyme
MFTSNIGIKLIKEFESFRGEAYLDPAGNPTIGWGTTRIYGYKIQLGMVINELVGDVLFKGDLRDTEDEVNSVVRFKLNQNQFDALISFEYNTGGLASSTLLKMINNEHPWIKENLFTRWNKATVNGKLIPLAGLTRRRKAEFALYVKN